MGEAVAYLRGPTSRGRVGKEGGRKREEEWK